MSLKYVIKREGQDYVSTSDQVVVSLMMSLPAVKSKPGNENYMEISPEFRFGSRLDIGGQPLTFAWGTINLIHARRGLRKFFKASTWAAAESTAEAYAQKQKVALDEAMAARALALKNAGD